MVAAVPRSPLTPIAKGPLGWEAEELAVAAAAQCLVPCAGVTGPNVFIDELPHPWPYVFPRDHFQRFILSQVAGRFPIVVRFQDP